MRVREFLYRGLRDRDCGLLVPCHYVGANDHCPLRDCVRGYAHAHARVCEHAHDHGYAECRHCERAHARVDECVNDRGRGNVDVYRPLYAPVVGYLSGYM